MTETQTKGQAMSVGFTIVKNPIGYHVTIDTVDNIFTRLHVPSVGEAVDEAFAVLPADPKTLAAIREAIQDHFDYSPCELVDVSPAVEDGGYDLHFYFGGFITGSFNANCGEVAPI